MPVAGLRCCRLQGLGRVSMILAGMLLLPSCSTGLRNYRAVCIDAESGNPIPGVSVIFLDEDLWQLTTAVVTDNSGIVSVSEYPSQSSVVCAYTKEYELFAQRLLHSTTPIDTLQMWRYIDLGPSHRYSIQRNYSLLAMEILALGRPLDFSVSKK